MKTARYSISLAHLESPLTEHCSEAAYRMWLSLIEFSLESHFPERGVFRFKWRVLEPRLLLAAHNAQAAFPIDQPKRRLLLFHELCEWHMIERRESDGAYFIRAAQKAHLVRIPPEDIAAPKAQQGQETA